MVGASWVVMKVSLIGPAGDGWRLVVGKAGAAEGAGSRLDGLTLVLVGGWAVWLVMVKG